MRARAARGLLLLALAALACGGPERHDAEGVVVDVLPEEGQVVIDHEDVPDLMPAMTMNFDVPDPELLGRLEPGQVIDFEIATDGRSYRVVEARVREQVEPREGYAVVGNRLLPADPAPEFRLIDQAGEPLALSDLAGRAVLLDFIYTRCPGPCPILTGLMADVQEALPEALQSEVHFVSISLDPTHDTPERMVRYARARGAELHNWSFLTGDPERVQEVVAAYGVGATRTPDGEIEHLVGMFLIDGEGRIVRRYLGLEQDAEAIARDLAELAHP